MAIHLTPEANPTVQEGTLYVDSATGEFNVAGRTTPHIIPGVLYPAYVASGTSPKLLDGTTTHGTGTYNGVAVSTAYGTVQADGRKYYYTNIAGSKPIKDPRIGGHFGSQRHKFKSLQLLEQETATHGSNVYSVDGREWCRLVGTYVLQNNDQGNVPYLDGDGTYIEITGYFSEANLISLTYSSGRDYKWKIDGGTYSADKDDFNTTVNSPLAGRYVDAGSVANIGISQTLGIHTLQIMSTGASEDPYVYGIELITQDTTSTANRSKIQIPSQDVVSYGKKFTVSGTPHYNPFNNQTIGDNTSHGKNTVGWTTYDSTLDTATSLGLDAWVDSGNYYRPVNGGRVIKWVDSSGNIKTSVNMMPPSAKAIGSHSGNSGPHQTAWTSTYQPVFSSGSVDHTQAEVAKTFHWREFGNGSANGGAVTTSTGGSYKDASMLSGDADIAYVMDDGLTSYSGDDATPNTSHTSVINAGGGTWQYITFIGTGVTLTGDEYYTSHAVAQNLPYGTHILRLQMQSGVTDQIYEIDGVAVYDSGSAGYGEWKEVTFHQPKKPPIPKDAVVLCDYMLMADFVSLPSSFADMSVPKGCRGISATRDIFANGQLSGNTALHTDYVWGYYGVKGPTASGSDTLTVNLPFFGTQSTAILQQSNSGSWSVFEFGGSATTAITRLDNTTSNHRDGILVPNAAQTLGQTSVTVKVIDNLNFGGFFLSTPIHTSHHYQTFETPFLHELVGGDRNMEQHNLVCSPDGKTWDQLTRDTSYIGNQTLSFSRGDTNITSGNTYIFDYTRGTTNGNRVYFNKDWAIAYDRVICLKDGQYSVDFTIMSAGDADRITITVNYNGSNTLFGAKSSQSSGEKTQASNQMTKYFKRGDYLYLTVAGNTAFGTSADGLNAAKLEINRV